ncbi:histidinol-phosphate aminotransferase [Fistulina hepatica ATCC 64428]|uniref:histidinol-phosphate transaminase n=1 Tax=Fistulina hepatica ATCC 64428 TaxID=1128425 RepID=A0A0D7ACV4_9AGAR|nr:histidinol-phosphate aminotransferase [Fistulina hepatica ATCC 64428]
MTHVGYCQISAHADLHFDIEKVIRPNILALHPYRCARDDYQDGILLDANENSMGHSIPRSSAVPSDLQSTLDLKLHRYPDPSHPAIKQRIADLRGLPGTDYVFLGVGSDEVIDLLMRVCVAPGQEKILTTPPTYGMYAVCAQVNDVGVVKVPLELSASAGEGGEHGRFSLRVDAVKAAIDADPSIKLVFLCSPGNPTGTTISLQSLRSLLEYEKFKGIVIVDEAYIDFADPSCTAASLVPEFANLCVLQTLSKSFGLAAIRLGVALAAPPLIQILTNTKAPYNISMPTAHLALAALSPEAVASMHEKARALISGRKWLLDALSGLREFGVGPAIGRNEANFLMTPILSKKSTGDWAPDNARAQSLYRIMAEERGVVMRFRGNEPGCEACLRITVGTPAENEAVVTCMRDVLGRI